MTHAESTSRLEPWDAHNQRIAARVHPADWVNPTPSGRYDLVVIGGGTAGLVTAAGAAGLGAKVALVERNLLGGDCLNTGCVPSKCLIRAARAAADVIDAEQFGVRVPAGTEIDFPAVMERMRRLRADISQNDSAERFAKLGVAVYIGAGRFVDRTTLEVAGATLRFRRAVIATGGRPIMPAIPGLDQVGALTNETIFSLTRRPERLTVIGGGPIGCELAQAFQRLGSKVVLVHKNPRLLDREDPNAAEIVRRSLSRDGVRVILGATVDRLAPRGGRTMAFVSAGAGETEWVADHVLVATGRAPNVEGLDLERAGVGYDRSRGIVVNDHLQTANSRIYAAGDVCMKWKFTHAADAAARIVIQNALFFGRKRLSALTVPRVTFTDPEVAAIGLSERDASESGIGVKTFERPLADVDRAITDGETEGFVRIRTLAGSDRIVGATIVARHAGEMIGELGVAMAAKMGLGKLANVIHPYPTQAEAIKGCADAYNRTRLTPSLKRWLSRWFALGR